MTCPSAWPVTATGAGLVSAMTCPSSISMRRRVRAATAWSWVMMTTVVPGRVELLQQGQDGRAGGRVEVAGGLVGQHDRRARRRSPGRSRPAAARPRTAGSAGRRPGARARPGPARRRPAGAARRGAPRRTAARRPRCPARSGARRGRTAGTRTRPATPAAPTAHRSRIRATSRPVTRTVPLVGLSRVPIRCSSVDLPDPDGPTTATSSPAATVRLTPVERPHRRLPRVHLRHPLQFQHRYSGRPVSAGLGRPRFGHDAATTTRWPGVSAPVTCTRPEVSSKIRANGHRHPAPRVPRADNLHDVPAGGLGHQRRHRHREHRARAAFGGDVHRHRRLVQGPGRRGSVSATCTGIVVVGSCPCPDPDVVVATVPTEDTTPGVGRPVRQRHRHASPALTSDCCETSSGIVTTSRSDVAASTGPFAGPPRLPVTGRPGSPPARTPPARTTATPAGRRPPGALQAAARLGRLPGVVVPAKRDDIRAVGVAEPH